jgi:hypothetical protein
MEWGRGTKFRRQMGLGGTELGRMGQEDEAQGRQRKMER